MIAAKFPTFRHKSASRRFQDNHRGAAYLRCRQFGGKLAAVLLKPTEAKSVAKAENEILEHIPGLRRYARALTGNSAEADDLVQESLSRALTRCGKAGEIRNLRA